MDSFETQCRRLIDGLVRDLGALASDLGEREIERARAEQREREKAAPRVSPRLLRALERAEERRRLAAERRAAALAARPARRPRAAAAGPAAATAPASRAGRAPAPVVPPPLFVHKRSRDGSSQKLERAAGEAAPQA